MRKGILIVICAMTGMAPVRRTRRVIDLYSELLKQLPYLNIPLPESGTHSLNGA